MTSDSSKVELFGAEIRATFRSIRMSRVTGSKIYENFRTCHGSPRVLMNAKWKNPSFRGRSDARKWPLLAEGSPYSAGDREVIGPRVFWVHTTPGENFATAELAHRSQLRPPRLKPVGLRLVSSSACRRLGLGCIAKRRYNNFDLSRERAASRVSSFLKIVQPSDIVEGGSSTFPHAALKTSIKIKIQNSSFWCSPSAYYVQRLVQVSTSKFSTFSNFALEPTSQLPGNDLTTPNLAQMILSRAKNFESDLALQLWLKPADRGTSPGIGSENALF
ncbi:hypothetical protein R3P38DRAFT_2776822 [Favolaschia claudopus]|uniref:Uncharacterized protein n=1 Tax=Favolaschia claudopus TaxID=2862362 RepID=A0AAW0BLB0_9AGAR